MIKAMKDVDMGINSNPKYYKWNQFVTIMGLLIERKGSLDIYEVKFPGTDMINHQGFVRAGRFIFYVETESSPLKRLDLLNLERGFEQLESRCSKRASSLPLNLFSVN